MARFTTAGGEGSGAPGPQGPAGSNGADGADALWNYTGEYNGGSSYAVGDLATYDGQLWYRANANGGNVGDTPSEGFIWDLLAAKGVDGSGGLVYLGNYISGNGYVADLAVVRGSDNNLYIAKASGGLADPVGNTAEWDIFSTNSGGGTDNHGDFYFDATTLRVDSSDDMILEANEGDSTVAAQIKVGNGDIPIEIASYQQDSNSFGTSDWSTAEWQSDGNGAGQIVITGSTNVIDFLNTSFNGSFQKITVNNEFMSTYNGGSYGGDAATLYVSTEPEGGITVTITTLIFTWSNKSGITIDYDYNEINIVANDMQLNIDSTGNEDININASDDLRLESGDDMFLRSNGYINFVSSNNDSNYEWRMESNGTLEFPARGRLRNPSSSSGDGNGYDTFHIIPDFGRYEYDQYLIVDPTAPNHIHIRAGGTQDSSTADLIIGGENTNVVVSDGQQSVIIKGDSGEFLNYVDANNQIATIGDVTTAVGVGGNGEVTRWSPNFQATGLVFTGTDNTYPTYNSHYVKNGRMVSFWIAIDLATVINFGTGQYKTELPFAPLTGTMNHFQAWANVDPTVNPDIAGHVVLQADHLADTDVLDLHYLKQAGGANSPLMEALFVQGTPATLTTSSKIYINGTYITAE